MANSIESQTLFLNMLDKAEHEVGFITDDYKLSIEAIALSNGTFILTVTRIEKETLKSNRVHAKRKDTFSENNVLIYKFANFDDFCNFENFLSVSFFKFTDYFSEFNSLYQYKNYFFLILENIKNEYSSEISSIISEFAVPIQSSELIIHKIKEYGLLVTNKAIHKTS